MQSREWPAWYISHIYIYIYTYICYIAYIHIYVQISARIYIYIYTRIQSTSVTHRAKRVPQINESLHTYELNFCQRMAKTHMVVYGYSVLQCVTICAACHSLMKRVTVCMIDQMLHTEFSVLDFGNSVQGGKDAYEDISL